MTHANAVTALQNPYCTVYKIVYMAATWCAGLRWACCIQVTTPTTTTRGTTMDTLPTITTVRPSSLCILCWKQIISDHDGMVDKARMRLKSALLHLTAINTDPDLLCALVTDNNNNNGGWGAVNK